MFHSRLVSLAQPPSVKPMSRSQTSARLHPLVGYTAGVKIFSLNFKSSHHFDIVVNFQVELSVPSTCLHVLASRNLLDYSG